MKIRSVSVVLCSLFISLISHASNVEVLADSTPPARVASMSSQNLKVHSVALRWSASYDDFTIVSQLQYNVFRAEMSPRLPVEFAQVAAVKGVLTFIDNSLTRRGYYAYYVVAQDESGNMAHTSPVINVQN